MVPCRKATEIQRYLDAFGMVDCVVFGVLTVYDYNAQLVVVNRTFAHESSSQYSSPECSRPHVMPTYMSACPCDNARDLTRSICSYSTYVQR